MNFASLWRDFFCCKKAPSLLGINLELSLLYFVH
jgi:hypothetical protein